MPHRPIGLPHARIDLDRQTVQRAGEELALTVQEAALLAYLAERSGEAVSRADLLAQVWGYHPGLATRAVDNTVARLRTKIERDPKEPKLLRTVYGLGYRLDLPQSALPAPGPRTFPAPMGTNLTPAQDPFFGRAEALAALAAALEQGGLFTLTGPAGVGKTRLAREMGLRLAELLPGGAWFVDLSEALSPQALSERVATVLDAPSPQAEDPAAAELRLGHVLRSRGPALLILDNLEQLLPGAADLLARWREAAPELRLLATSQRRIELPGEWVLDLGPLDAETSAELFAARARRIRPGFALGPASAKAVAELVERLDHLPLAVELAASWADVLPPERVLERLSGALHLAARQSGGGRHRSLEAALSWSWGMLSPALARGFAAAAVFRGGFDLEAAEAVLGPGALGTLEALRDRSLARFSCALDRPDEPRFALLLSVADFARRQEGASEAAVEAHAACFLALGERLAADGRPEAARRLGLELENLLAAQRASRASAPQRAVRLALVADLVLRTRGPLALRLAVLDDAVAQAGVDRELHVRARLARADALRVLGRLDEAEADLAQAWAEDDGSRDAPLALAEAMWFGERGELQNAVALATQAALSFRAGGDLRGEAAAERLRAVMFQELGALPEAEQAAECALDRCRQTGDRVGAAEAAATWANAMLAGGRPTEARARYAEALELHRSAGNRWGEATVLGNLGTALFEEGSLDRAEAAYAEAIAGHRAVGNRRYEGMCLSNAGVLAWSRGDAETARQRLGQAILAHAESKNARSRAYAQLNLSILDHAHGRPARASLDALAPAAQALGDGRLHGIVSIWRALLRAEDGELGAAEALLATVEHPACAAERALVAAGLAERRGEPGAWATAQRPTEGPAGSRVARDALRAAIAGWLARAA